MWALCKKEISTFFGSLTGWLIILVFFLITALFLWVFPGDMNILESGYASLEPLFFLAPWVFLFLVPAITMRMIAEERRTGTFELLLTKPLTELQIVLAKYLASLVLIFFSLIPCLIFFVSVYLLGNPPGNIDTGATWGSFIGLFFLASVYASAGLLASSLTQHQIVAFVAGAALCFFLYLGFDFLGQLPVFSAVEYHLVSLGIQEHYQSVSRGVLEIADMAYFISVSAVILLFTSLFVQSRKW